MPKDNRPNPASIPIEDVARYPLPGAAIPANLAFSPDDRLLTYLFSPQGDLTRQLYAFDPQINQHRLLAEPSGDGLTEENVSLEEVLRRERLRQRELGVTLYAWAESANRLLLPFQGNVYVCDGVDQPLRKILDSQEASIQDAQFSPDGEWVAYVQDAELYVVPSQGGEPRQLTLGARGGGKTHGLAEYIAQEEMHRRHGFWWSLEGRLLAFAEVDETHIPAYRIIHQGKDSTGLDSQEEHRYPFAGCPNAKVRLGVASIAGGDPVWMDLGDDEDIYLARVQWLPDGRLSAQIQNREQSRLELVAFDPRNGLRTRLLCEESQVWINLHDMFWPLKKPYEGQSGCFIWASERSGYRHLYLYAADGRLMRQLTTGEWGVDALSGVDEEAGLAYFSAGMDDPRECQFYAVSLRGGKPRRITSQAGTHSVVLDHACQRFVDTHHSLRQPPTVRLRSLKDGAILATLHARRDGRIDELGLQPPNLVSLQNRHGLALYGAIYHPDEERFGPGPYPTLVHVYGGPHKQMAANSWELTGNMRAQYLRSLGFLVFMLDNRGSARRGLEFEAAIKGDMGHVEVEDQVDGVRWLVATGLADPERVGVYGWSYGGYMAAMCLFRAPETFKAAVAGAPVAHWDGYDTHYTERYMGTPQSNPRGYLESSLMHHAENLKGKLLLLHGLIDENVHFRHTARLINALIAARKPYELLLFPDERHMPRRLEDRVYMEERIRDFFLENL
jgi:dipeptidyl-peptidase-4